MVMVTVTELPSQRLEFLWRMPTSSPSIRSSLLIGLRHLVPLDSLPLLYAGYGLLGGTGVGLGYTPPVQALISWFPDRRGLASGLTIAG